MPDIQVDVMTNEGGHFTGGGAVGQRLIANNMDAGALRPYFGDNGRPYITVNGVARPTTNATLRKDEWKHLESAVLMAAKQRLVGVNDLYSRNLVYRISNGLGTTVFETQTMSDTEAAQVSMDAATRGRRDRPNFGIGYLPLPVVHKDFQIDARTLAASRNGGQPLDTIMAEDAGRMVAEKLETMLFNGLSTYTFGGGTIYGYTDFTNRNTYTLTAHWDDSLASGTTILSDVLGMVQASIDDYHYGPWVLYIPTNYQTALGDDFKAASDKSIRQRLLEIDGIQDIKVADKLTADEVVLVSMNTDTVRMVEGLGIQMLEWESEGGMLLNYKVMGIMVPQIRSDYNSRCGIVHGSK